MNFVDLLKGMWAKIVAGKIFPAIVVEKFQNIGFHFEREPHVAQGVAFLKDIASGYVFFGILLGLMLLVTLFGQRLAKIWRAVLVFVFGFVFGCRYLPFYLPITENSLLNNEWALLAIAVVFGLLFLYAARYIWGLTVIAVVGCVSYYVGFNMIAAWIGMNDLAQWVGLGTAVLAVLLFFIFRPFCTRMLTSLVGASLCVGLLGKIVDLSAIWDKALPYDATASWMTVPGIFARLHMGAPLLVIEFIIGAALFLIGHIVQFRTRKRF